MSVFSIKLKTRNGNDIKKKETITVFFRAKFKKGLRVTVEYTYRIICSKGIIDPGRVLEFKGMTGVRTIEDVTLRVLLNLTHIVGILTHKEGIDPDFVMFISPEFDNKINKSWLYLKDIFFRPSEAKSAEEIEQILANKYTEWDDSNCHKLGLLKQHLDMLYEYSRRNTNTKFMFINPLNDTTKYSKSIHICNMLQDRIDRNLQITEDSKT